jgi:glycosyltransferase involved in cell wall biosynthesis
VIVNAPTVSILIPVYNREDFIAPCIESALSQTIADFEIIIVDNASTDKTWEICKHYASSDSRVKVFRNDTNLGPVKNWRRCAEEAQGKYGKILFSDDLMAPDFLEHTLPKILNPEVAFVVSGILLGETLKSSFEYLNIGFRMLSNQEYFVELINRNITYSPGAAIFRISDIKENLKLSFPTRVQCNFGQNGAGPDVMLYALTALKYKYAVFIAENCVFFRSHSGSFSVGNGKEEVQKNYSISLAWFCKAHLGRASWSKHVANTWLSRVKKDKGIHSLNKLFYELEGDITFFDYLRVCAYIFFGIIRYIFKSLAFIFNSKVHHF